VGLQPRPVLSEVGPDRTDEQRGAAEHAERERDVAGHATGPDHHVVDQEAEGEPVELLQDDLVGEPTGEMHQLVGGDGPRHGDRHGESPYRRDGPRPRVRPGSEKTSR
jgi:hypothetical protein